MVSEYLHLVSWIVLWSGGFFFVAGTAGLLRFPDMFARLHAVTKADTAGLGLIVLGLSLQADTWQPVLVMVLIWVLVMASSATACQLLARYGQEGLNSEEQNPKVQSEIVAEKTCERH